MKILILEDSINDFELIIHELRRTGIPFESRRVETEDQYVEALHQFKPDLILTDYALPGFDGITALRLAQEHVPLVPVIVVTGVLDDKTESSLVAAGASDFVSKDHFSHLATAITRSMQIARVREERDRVEGALSGIYAEMERRVNERTEELSALNSSLRFSLTDRMRLEQEINKREKMYRDLVESANSIIVRWSVDGKIVFVNQFGLDFFGYAPEEFIGKDINLIIPSEESGGRNLEHLVNDILENFERYANFENENKKRNGERAWIAWANRAIYDEKGRVTEILAIGNDVTRSKYAERMLREREQQLRTLVDNTPDVIIRYDRQRRILFANSAANRIMGFNPAEIAGKTNRDMGLPDNLDDLLDKTIQMVFDGAQKQVMEFSWGKPPQVTYFRSQLVPEFDSNGKFDTVLAIAHDVTDVREAQEALRRDEERLNLIIRNSPDLIFQQDREGIFVWVPSVPIPGIPRDLTGKTEELFLSENEAARIRKIKEEVVRTGKGVTTEFSANLDGAARYFEAVYEPWIEGNATNGILGYVHEITGRKKAEEELSSANRYLAEINRMKTEFVSMAAHEMKTPITSMIAFAQTLQSGEIQLERDERERFLKIIENEGMRLANLLNDLLDITKIEAGVIELEQETIDLRHLITETLEQRIIPENVTVITHLPQDPAIVCIDKNRIRQVITNFIDNAIRYGGNRIIIETEIGDTTVTASVADNGPGIRHEELEKIFEKFYRTKDSRQKEKGKGSGLGLAIAKGIIEAHGGTIGAESVPGKGARFYFTLKRGACENL